MDGLTVSTGKQLLETGKTFGEMKADRIKDNMAPAPGSGEKTFAQSLNDAVGQVNQLQKTADNMEQKLATGEIKNIPEVLVAVEKADIALKLMVQVRNKIIDAYQEVMKMQV